MGPLRQIEDTYWPIYVYDVLCELQMQTTHVSYKEALREAIQRRNTGVYRRFLQNRQEWNQFVQTLHTDMKRTYGMHVGIAEAVAEACNEKDYLEKGGIHTIGACVPSI
jgi:hypothetical protein